MLRGPAKPGPRSCSSWGVGGQVARAGDEEVAVGEDRLGPRLRGAVRERVQYLAVGVVDEPYAVLIRGGLERGRGDDAAAVHVRRADDGPGYARLPDERPGRRVDLVDRAVVGGAVDHRAAGRQVQVGAVPDRRRVALARTGSERIGYPLLPYRSRGDIGRAEGVEDAV